MVSSSLAGGLGNQLFQIAAGYSLAIDNNVDFVCYLEEDKDKWPHSHHADRDDTPAALKDSIYRKIKRNSVPIEANYFEHPTYEKIQYKPGTCLGGHFQTEQYFAHNREKILELFQISAKEQRYIESKYDLKSEETVSLHVRRGDRVHVSTQTGCSFDYYKRALEFFDKEPAVGIVPLRKIFVFSDDIEWCRMLAYSRPGIKDRFVFVEGEKPQIDLYMMSMCTHNIICHSTFSWWGAWLNDNPKKQVIAPKQSDTSHTYGLIPDHWKTLEKLQTSVPCTPPANVVHFISYGDERFTESKARIAKEAAATKWFDTIKVYGPEDVEQYKESFNRVYELSEENENRGGGYWIWKILLLRQCLSEISDGEFLVYADAGCTIHKGGEEKFKQYLQLLTESEYGIVSFRMTEIPEKVWVTKQLLSYFNVKEDNHDVLDSGQMHATFIILQKNKHSTRVLHECFKCLLHDCTLITDIYNDDQADYFEDNRHDQSILSLACKIYGSVVIPDTAAYDPGPHHGHPFWASRISC